MRRLRIAIRNMTSHQKLAFVSALRGIAALYVITIHLHFGTSPKVDAPGWLVPAIGFGGTAVTLFFVLSAFTLSMSFDERKDEPSPVASFYIRRLFRIAPLFYIWLLIAIAIAEFHFNVHVSAWRFLLNLFFIFNVVPGEEWGITYAGWSVGVEMLFYAVFPAVFALCRTRRSTTIFLVAAICAGHVWQLLTASIAWPFPYTGIINQLPVFIMGMYSYHAYKALCARRDARKIGILLVCLSLAGFYVMAYHFVVPHPAGSLYIRSLFCSTLIVGLGLAPVRFAVNRITTFFGEISYSVYLSHSAGCLLVAPLSPWFFDRFSTLLAFVLCYLLLMLFVIPVSLISYRYVETPGIALGRRLISRIREKRGLVTSEASRT